MLSQQQLLRYTRHLPVIGQAGQAALLAAKVLCIGAGGLGSPVLQYLAAAGVGQLGIVDDDHVELSNLQRQILYSHQDIGQPKANTAAKKIGALNPTITIDTFDERLTADNIETLFSQYDVIVDGTDNYQTRYLINDYAYLLNKPLVSASIYQCQGQISVFNYQQGPCLRCLYPSPPPSTLTPNCAQGGVLGVVAGLTGTLQACEAIKIILNIGNILTGQLLTVDALSMQFKTYDIKKNASCPLCCHQQLSADLFTTNPSSETKQIDPQALSVLKKNLGDDLVIIDVREPYEREICDIGGELIPLADIHDAPIHAAPNAQIITYCKTGVRSQSAAHLLQQRGYHNCMSLKGGILLWIDEIDPTLRKY